MASFLSVFASGCGQSSDQVADPSSSSAVIFIGDGMGISTVTAARIFEGQLNGGTGEENALYWEQFPHVGLSKTYNTNQQVPDSAGTATAIFTGQKTKAGMLSVGPASDRGDCLESKNHRLKTLMEIAAASEYSVGIVTSARLTHATPAAAIAHSPERDWESDSEMPRQALEQGCKDIARQIIEFEGLDVAFGGGRKNFLPVTMVDPEYPDRTGARADGKDLISAWEASRPTAKFVWNREQFDRLEVDQPGPLLGLFEPSHMGYESEKKMGGDDDPSLAELTRFAITHLKSKKRPFILLVEGGRIDHGHHAGRAYLALTETVELSRAVAIADDLTDDSNTLMIVTADHSHVFTMAGYPVRGNPILGKVESNNASGSPSGSFAIANDGLPYTTLGYYNGPGATNQRRADLSDIDTEAADFVQQALIALNAETHGGEDVAIYSKGPGSENLSRVLEQNRIFDVVVQSLELQAAPEQ